MIVNSLNNIPFLVQADLRVSARPSPAVVARTVSAAHARWSKTLRPLNLLEGGRGQERALSWSSTTRIIVSKIC